MEQTRKEGLLAGLKKHWAALVIITLLLIITVFVGTLYTRSVALITQIVGTYCTVPDENTRPGEVIFQNDTYTFLSDGNYLRYGQHALLEEGQITFVDRYIFRLTPAQGNAREIMFIDGVVYERDSDGRYAEYYLASKVPALYGGPE